MVNLPDPVLLVNTIPDPHFQAGCAVLLCGIHVQRAEAAVCPFIH